MEISLTLKNVVIVGDFIPSKFDKFFFVKNNIFTEEEILDESIFSSEMTQVLTDSFHIIIVSNQFILTEKSPGLIDAVSDRLIKIVTASQFTATALGNNIHWYIFSEDKTRELSKKYFYNENSVLVNQFFDTDDTGYGYYVSKDFGNARLKLDIKPVTVTKIDTNTNQRVIMFSFNFHVDLNKANCKEKILSALSELKDYFDETRRIMSIYENEK